MVIHESDNSLEYISLYLNDLRVRMLEENCWNSPLPHHEIWRILTME
jgi:hypothetical protein